MHDMWRKQKHTDYYSASDDKGSDKDMDDPMVPKTEKNEQIFNSDEEYSDIFEAANTFQDKKDGKEPPKEDEAEKK
jgi:hypothetical protein